MPHPPLDLSPEDLHRRLRAGDDIQLIDVREEVEFEYCHLPGSRLVPLDELPHRAAEIHSAGPVVVICHHGVRSAHAAGYLRHLGRTNVLNLRGGVAAWAAQVDADFPVY